MGSDSARVCLGVIVGSKGLRGEVRVKSHTEYPEDVAAYGPVATDDGRTLNLTVTGAAKGVVIARVDGVSDRTEADALKGLRLYVARDALPPPEAGVLYQVDLIGFAVVRADNGETAGTVAAFHNFGAGDVMEVERPEKDSLLIPFTSAVIAEVDTAGGRILVTPLPGLLDGGESGPDVAGDGGQAGDDA